jgi:hypothetical protein
MKLLFINYVNTMFSSYRIDERTSDNQATQDLQFNRFTNNHGPIGHDHDCLLEFKHPLNGKKDQVRRQICQ